MAMSDNEALKWLKAWSATHQNENDNIRESVWLAIKALEERTMFNEIMHELSEYQAIGTVEDIQEVMALCKSLQETVCRYMNIGTIEEFKALKEKIAKIEFILNEKNYIKAEECDYGNYYTCENALMIKDIEEIING